MCVSGVFPYLAIAVSNQSRLFSTDEDLKAQNMRSIPAKT